MAGEGPGQTLFDLWSRVYDLPPVQRLVYRPIQDAVVTTLKQRAPRRILDVGCGTGLLTSRLSDEMNADVVGCDFSGGMLEQAQRRSTRPWWVQGDATTLPFATASFDGLACTESFHWYPDQGQAAREFARVLRPGGVAVVALVNPPSGTEPAARVFSRLARSAAHWPSRAEMRGLLTGAGLRLVSQRRLPRVGGFLAWPSINVAVTGEGPFPNAERAS